MITIVGELTILTRKPNNLYVERNNQTMQVISYPTGKEIRYNDLSLRVIASLAAAHIVTEYGGSKPWLQRLLSKMYYVEFGTTLVFTFLLVYYIYRWTCFLDIRLGWHEKPVKRGILQFAGGVIAPTMGAFFLAALYFAYFDINILDTNYHLYALPFIAALITIFNTYYLIRYLIAERSYYQSINKEMVNIPIAETRESASTTDPQKPVFMVHTITKSFPVAVEDIAYFYRDANHVFLRPFEGEDYLLTQSLDEITKNLGNANFFRVARHMLISRRTAVSYSTLSYGKLAVTLDPPYKELVTASKPLAHNFRLWVASPL